MREFAPGRFYVGAREIGYTRDATKIVSTSDQFCSPEDEELAKRGIIRITIGPMPVRSARELLRAELPLELERARRWLPSSQNEFKSFKTR